MFAVFRALLNFTLASTKERNILWAFKGVFFLLHFISVPELWF